MNGRDCRSNRRNARKPRHAGVALREPQCDGIGVIAEQVGISVNPVAIPKADSEQATYRGDNVR